MKMKKENEKKERRRIRDAKKENSRRIDEDKERKNEFNK